MTNTGQMESYLPIVGGIVIATVGLLYLALPSIFKERGSAEKSCRDVVILHITGRGPKAPNVSPFGLKLETYLRMANIPYQHRYGPHMSSKGKTPWMVYNGVEVADSQLCIDYLKRLLGHDMNGHLNTQQKAVARAFQKMVEEDLYWTLCATFFGGDLRPLQSVLPYTGIKLILISWILRYKIQKELWGQGIGRHTAAEVVHIGRSDAQALSDYMGERRFLMGDEPCETDCALFGMLAQMKWHMPGTIYEKMINEELLNLSAYCDRMKERFWPDWDDCISAGGKRPTVA